MTKEEKMYPCPCCGFLTLSEGCHGTFEICPVCFWEDDGVQYNNPNFQGGANEESLNEARQNYKQFGASSKRIINDVRKPFPEEIPPAPHFCRVCGLDQGEPPWGEDNRSPTFGICSCCGVEFGYQDCTLKAIRAYREHWLTNGGKWRYPNEKPAEWSLEEQMNNIPQEYK